MKVIVTGGSGFIGSSVVDELLLTNMYDVVIVDRKMNSWSKRLYGIHDNVELIEDDIRNLRNNHFGENVHGVIHLAADHIVSDSVRNPMKFYQNNIGGLLHLLKILNIDQRVDDLSNPMLANHSKPLFVYSSSAAIYQSQPGLIRETSPKIPINAYGLTKFWGEEILNACSAYNMNHVSLRYFNVAGAGLHHGYITNPATHVIPILIECVKTNNVFKINGNTYNTPDGTCVRDYVHVKDLARAHVLALQGLNDHRSYFPKNINLGLGCGISVKELIKIAERTLSTVILYEYGNKREGDPDVLVANIERATDGLKWTPKYSISDMISDHWSWMR